MSAADSTGNTSFLRLQLQLPPVTALPELRTAFSFCSLAFSAVNLSFCK